MDIFLLYLFTRVDSLKEMLTFVLILGGIGGGFLVAFGGFSYRDDEIKAFREKWLNKYLLLTCAMMVLSVATPRQKDLAIIIGGHFAIEAAQSGTAKKVYAIVQDVLDEKLAEIAKKKKP